MRVIFRAALLLTAFFACALACQADPIVSLSSNAPNLNSLSVGDNVTLTVSLSGLNPGDSLDFLGTDIAFDASLLGTPSAITPGAIVPDVTGFASGVSPGVGSALYDDLFAVSSTPIISNGDFFSFSVMALAPGSGTIAFIPLPSSSGTAADGSPLAGVTAGSALDFTIVGNVATPEPSSLILLGTGAASAGFLRLLRRRRWASR